MIKSGLTPEGTPAGRSLGLKLIVVCGLAILMTIPSFLVSGLVNERTRRAREVSNEIGGRMGGPQTFLGPTLAIPYTIASTTVGFPDTRGVYLVFPAQASVKLGTKTVDRHRSLFRVPVFNADLSFDSSFDLRGVPTAAPTGSVLDWRHAEMIVGVSDTRGALADATLTANNKTETFTPAEAAEDLSIGTSEKARVKLVLLGAAVAELAKPEALFHTSCTLRFSGAERLAVLAYGKTTHMVASGNWRDPGFDGGILPVRRDVTAHGFSAEWRVPFIARGVSAEGTIDSVTGLNATALGISFVEVADAYQSVDRSLKYVLLILGLVFVSYFLFEVTSGKKVHPAQYILVGIAQLVFYLLLLSIAERIGFDVGFLLAAAATVAILSVNAGWIFGSRLQMIRALAVFTMLYGFIYVLLRLEDNALLVGAISSFIAVATVMYFTRGLDWYGSYRALGTSVRPLPTPPTGGAI